MKIKKSKRLLSLFLSVIMLLTAFPIAGLTASADTSAPLFKFTQMRTSAANSHPGEKTDARTPIVADSIVGAYSFAVSGFTIGDISFSDSLKATLSGTFEDYAQSTPISNLNMQFHVISDTTKWNTQSAGYQDLAGATPGWDATGSGSRGTISASEATYSYVANALGLGASTLIGSVAHGQTSYSFDISQKLQAAKNAGQTQIRIITIYSSDNSASDKNSACWMTHPSLTISSRPTDPSSELFQFTQFRTTATNTLIGDRTDAQIPLVSDSTGAYSYAVAGFDISNVNAAQSLAIAALSGTIEKYSTSTPISNMKIEFHLVPSGKLWDSLVGANTDAWKQTTQGSRGGCSYIPSASVNPYTSICSGLTLNADTLIGSVSHGSTSYSFNMADKILAAREAGATQIKIIALYTTVNTGSASSACWMNHPSLTISSGSMTLESTYSYAGSNKAYDAGDNNRYNKDGSTRIDITNDTKGNNYSYGVWRYDISSIDPNAVKIDRSLLTVSRFVAVASTIDGAAVDFYLVPASKMTNAYVSQTNVANNQYHATDLGNPSGSYNPSDKIKTALGLSDTNLIGTIEHQGTAVRSWTSPFAGRLQARVNAGEKEIIVVALPRKVVTVDQWSDMQINHPTIELTLSPKGQQAEIVANNLAMSDWGIVNAEKNYSRYNENEHAVNLVSEKKTNPSSNVFSMGWWTYDLPKEFEDASIDSAPLKVSVLQKSGFGYATPSIADMAVDFYVVDYSKYGNYMWFTQSTRQVTDAGFANGAEKALQQVKTTLGLGDSVATLIHGVMTNTYRLHNAVRDAVKRGDSKLMLVAVQRTPNTLNGTAKWSDTWLNIPEITVNTINKTYETTITRDTDEDAVVGRVTVNNAIYTRNVAALYQYGHQIANNSEQKTTFTVHEGTLKEIFCVDDGDNSNLSWEGTGSTLTLTGRLEADKFTCDPQKVDMTNGITATIMFVFTDGAIEYHRVAVKSLPVPAHVAIRSWKSGGYQSGWVAVARGSTGHGAAGTWKYLDNWKSGTQAHDGSASHSENWLKPEAGYPNAGNWGDGEHTQTANKVTANYYFDKSNHNLGSGKYFDSDTSDYYTIPLQLHTTYFSANTFPRDLHELGVNTYPTGTTIKTTGLNGLNTNGAIDGEVTIRANKSIAATDITADGAGDKSCNFRVAARSMSNSWGSEYYHVYKFDVVVSYFDKSQLRNQYTQSVNKKYDENKYTATSYANYVNTLLEVETWLSDYEKTQNHDTALAAKLSTAELALEPRADLSELDKAYRAADLAIRTASAKDPMYTSKDVNYLIQKLTNITTRELIDSSYDERRDYSAARYQTSIDSRVKDLNDAVAALVALETSSYDAVLPESMLVDKDIFDKAQYDQALEKHEQGLVDITYEDRTGNEFVVKALTDSTQNDLDTRVAEILTLINNALHMYKVTIPDGVTSDLSLDSPIPYGTIVTLTSENPDTVWYMEYDSTDTSHAAQYQTVGTTYTFTVYGNMTITTGERTDDLFKVTIERKYTSSNTNLPIEDIMYVPEGTVIDLAKYIKTIPFYAYVNCTDLSGKEIKDSKYTVGKTDATVYINYRYDSAAAGNYEIKAYDIGGTSLLKSIPDAAYNSRVDLKGSSGTYAWVEQVLSTSGGIQYQTWRPFYMNKDVTFFVQEDVVLKAVTQDEFVSLFGSTEVAASNLMQRPAMDGGADATGPKMIVNAQYVVPKDGQVLEWGILFNRGEALPADTLDEDLVLEKIPDEANNLTADGQLRIVRAKATKNNGANQYSIKMSKLNNKDASGQTTYQYRSYVIYQYPDATNKGKMITRTIYSDARTETVIF